MAPRRRPVGALVAALLLLLACAVQLCAAYPSGAPDLACPDQLPQHDASPSAGTGGYVVAFTGQTGAPSYTAPAPLRITVTRDMHFPGSQDWMGHMVSMY